MECANTSSQVEALFSEKDYTSVTTTDAFRAKGTGSSVSRNTKRKKKRWRKFFSYGMGNKNSDQLATSEAGSGGTLSAETVSDFRTPGKNDGFQLPSGIPAPTAVYKRYYPKEIHQQRVANKFFRSCSLDLHFTDNGSPVPKKPRFANDSFISLPLAPSTDNVPGIDQEMASTSICGFSPLEEEEEISMSASCPPPTTSGDAAGHGDQSLVQSARGPITSAVLKNGLKAKVRSVSSWFLSDHAKSANQDRNTIVSSRSIGSSVSRFKGSFMSLNKLGSFNFRKRKMATDEHSINSDQMSTASLNSLSDGRTPWPIPWLEAVFLPEYPVKGPVSEKHFQVQNKSDVISNDAVRQMKDEVSIHESVGQCEFIANLYASWQSRTKLYTVLQYATGYGDLYDLWKDEGPFSEEVVRIFAAEIVTAIDYIHNHGIIYRDLKLENIVLDDNGHIQLVDFGLAKWLWGGDRTRTICGTLQYMAPEVVSGNGYDHAVDYWSLGVLVYILLTNNYPFPSAKDHLSLNFHAVELPETFTVPVKSLISQLLCLEPCDRLQSLNSLQETEFFRTLDFYALPQKLIHPFDYIPGMRRCNSCNTLTDGEMDSEDINLSGFDEQYELVSGSRGFDQHHRNDVIYEIPSLDYVIYE